MNPTATLLEWQQLGLVMAGGALGAGIRFLVGNSMLRGLGAGFPWGTLSVNLVGSFVAGFLMVWLQSRGNAGIYLRAFLIIGLVGGLTTFSTLMMETLIFAKTARGALVPTYLGITLAAGLLLVWLGSRVAEVIK
ncbi:fluoride efflux transporter CrcB [Stenotrophomonas sp. YIM B06876]|uniref:fluoride efflux transporter CrcB n=1 Tax=Stenotrophomonas sp. YIM B06876 TaxID=3060211 RepID=UPI002739E65D|nr:fluoride efflux transporter CrcB [Stenotrophomonas sp. YIM B06876]